MEKYKKLFNKKYSEILAPDLEIKIDPGWFIIVDRLLYNVNAHVLEQHKQAKTDQSYYFLKYKYFGISDNRGALVLLTRANFSCPTATGMEIMAQAWAGSTCCKCGAFGQFREYSKIRMSFEDKIHCDIHHDTEVKVIKERLRNN